MPRPLSATCSPPGRRRPAPTPSPAARSVVLDGVGQQVQQHLAQPHRVGLHHAVEPPGCRSSHVLGGAGLRSTSGRVDASRSARPPAAGPAAVRRMPRGTGRARRRSAPAGAGRPARHGPASAAPARPGRRLPVASRSSWVKPSTAFNGVRSSWLTRDIELRLGLALGHRTFALVHRLQSACTASVMSQLRPMRRRAAGGRRAPAPTATPASAPCRRASTHGTRAASPGARAAAGRAGHHRRALVGVQEGRSPPPDHPGGRCDAPQR
jgi:hypothetical protein